MPARAFLKEREHLLDGAATPPNLGREFCSPEKPSQKGKKPDSSNTLRAVIDRPYNSRCQRSFCFLRGIPSGCDFASSRNQHNFAECARLHHELMRTCSFRERKLLPDDR